MWLRQLELKTSVWESISALLLISILCLRLESNRANFKLCAGPSTQIESSSMLSHLDYCSSLSSKLKHKMQVLQNSSVCFSYKLSCKEHITALHYNLRVLKLKFTFKVYFGIFLYKIIHSKEPLSL